MLRLKYLDATGLTAFPTTPTRLTNRADGGARLHQRSQVNAGGRGPCSGSSFRPLRPPASTLQDNLDARYKALLSQLPYEQATTEFIKEHPDAVAYTVGSTEGSTEGGLPSTAQDLAWTNQNISRSPESYTPLPLLGSLRVPLGHSRSPSSKSNWTPESGPDAPDSTSPSTSRGSPSVLTDITNAHASGAYYGTVDNYEKAYASAADSAARSHMPSRSCRRFAQYAPDVRP